MTGSRRHGTGPRRLPVLLVVVTLLVLAGVANAAMQTRSVRTHSPAQHAQSIVTFTKKATSSAWYCAGPLPLGAKKEASSISVANLGTKAVTGHLVVQSATGASSTAPVSVGANAQEVYSLARSGPSTTGAATILVDSASVGVDEIIHSSTGPIVAPCVEHAGNVQYLAPGNTTGANNISLSIFDPGATPSVVSVSFATSTGATSPAFQGVPVPAGHVVVLSVGHEVPSRLLVATTVHATGGSVVAGALVLARDDRSDVTSLLSASPASASTWRFAAAPISSGAHQSFSVLNPGTTTAHVTLHLDGSATNGELSGVVPPGAVISLSPPAVSPRVTESAATLVASGGSVVVGREVLVASMIAPTAAERRGITARQRSELTVPPGFAVSAGVTGATRRWLLCGGEDYAKVSELVVVSNPGTVPAVVHVTTLGTGTPAAGAGSVLATVEVAAGKSVTIPLLVPASSDGEMPLEVVANRPVLAGDVLVAKGTDALGFSTVPGIPVS